MRSKTQIFRFRFLILWLVGFNSFYAQNSRPNIIIFISDDQSQIDVGCYGNEDVHTPNMDKLASEGMRFTRAYATSPMCVPSRSNIMTGLYPYKNGAQMNHFSMEPGTKSLPDYLKKLGYYVAVAGKIDVYPKPDYDEHVGAYFGRYSPASNRDDPRNETTTFLENYFSKEQTDKPLCLIIGTWWPHVPWPESKDFDPDEIKVPNYLVDTPETRKALAAYYQGISKADAMLGKILKSVEETGEKDNTVFMFFSDQGTQFPGAKWTTYDQGLRVPFIVRWPGKVEEGSTCDALISLTDITPTLIDLAGGEAIDHLDGKSFKDVFLGKHIDHREYVFAETSVEPMYWYNYTPSRTVIHKNGFQYIRNYYPGVRFVTHIDEVERNMFYFDSWVKKAETDEHANFLLNRYSYRPSEELYNLNSDRWELNNLIQSKEFGESKKKLQALLEVELEAQGESAEAILQGDLPTFHHNAYDLKQGISVSDMTFDKKTWNPESLYFTSYVQDLQQDGVLCEYFRQFRLVVQNNAVGVLFRSGEAFYSDKLPSTKGHIILNLDATGNLVVQFDGQQVLEAKLQGDFIKINGGYISCGLAREQKLETAEANYFKGEISGFRVSINELLKNNR